MADHRRRVWLLACCALIAGCKSENGGGAVAGTGAVTAGTSAAGMGAAGMGVTAGMGTAGTGTAGTGAAGTGTAGTAGVAGMGGGMAGGAAGMAGGGAGMAGGGAGTDAGAGMGGTGGMGAGAFTLTSADVADGEMLPAEHRCVALFGETGPSPALSWSGAPEGTMSFAVTLTDRTYMDYAHWTIYDIPATVTELPQGVPAGAMPASPAGAKQAPNSPALTGPGYFGPCGMSGVNTYEFAVHALDVATLPGLSGSSTVQQVRTAITEHEIGKATLTVMSGP